MELRKDIDPSDLPDVGDVLYLSFTVNYQQADESGISVKDNGEYINPITMVSGDGTNTSDEVCIGEECFYVMYSDEDSVTMLSKYNLYVGGDYNGSTWTAYGEESTGKQDSNMVGWISGQTLRKGITKFSDTNYWESTVSSYPSYVYNENSLLYSYVENYKTYLSTLGVTLIEARLITKEELEGLGCSSSSGNCGSAPSWVYSTTYWSGSADSYRYIYNVYSNSDFLYNDYTVVNPYGCRPVIVISKSYF